MTFSAKDIRLLIVEDNPGDFVLIEDYLKEEFETPAIHHAKTLNEAKEVFGKELHFDVILLDLTLPDASGERLVREVVKLSELAPVIVLTGYLDREFGIKALSFGISDYLLKDELTATQLFKSIAYSIERRRINLQIKESEEKYRDLFHLSPLPLWVYDVETYKFLNVNDSAIRQYGYSRNEFLSMTIKDIRPEEDLKILEEVLTLNRKTGGYYKGAFRHLKKNGEIIYVDVQSNEINFEGRRARLILSIDISERIKYIQAIEDQNGKMREIAWMQSHVVRAPLARLMGLVNLLNYDLTEGIGKEMIMKNILSSAHELDDVIRSIVKKTEQIENKSNDPGSTDC
ncbi:MAG TPA: PAS domain S-box protein [Cytophagales bacterium]|nr:PAS domain S-box protein [Cytophagales bacterium]